MQDYPASLKVTREKEFGRLNGTVYLDHAGATLYPKSLVERHLSEQLGSTVFGNPHSHHASSQNSTDLVELARERVLTEVDGLHDYHLVFTASATAALELLATSFPWTGKHPCYNEVVTACLPSSAVTNGVMERERPNEHEMASMFAYLDDNHTSVVGMREVAWKSGTKVVCFSPEHLCHRKSDEEDLSEATGCVKDADLTEVPHCLLAYPAQSNFNGSKYPLSWCKQVQGNELIPYSSGCCYGNWHVVLDISALVGTSSVSLDSCQPDFAVLSLYKWLGYPTGLGALFIHRRVESLLSPHFFGGGSVLAYTPWESFCERRRSVVERLECGTLPFLAIISLLTGFDVLHELVGSMAAIQRHTFQLTDFVLKELRNCTHYNGQHAVELYHKNPIAESTHGPVVTFNILKPDATYAGFSQVDKLASAHNIHIRTGCFCNTGACQRWLGLSTDTIKANFEAGHECGDNMDLVKGRPTGAVRASFGYMSTWEDAQVFVKFIRDCFVQTKPAPAKSCVSSVHLRTLQRLLLYPIKSCAAFEVHSWPTGSEGLQYDRQWMVVTGSGAPLNQKQHPRLCLVRPSINLEEEELSIEAPGMRKLTVSLSEPLPADSLRSRVCADRVCGWPCGDEASRWFTDYLNTTTPCLLLRQDTTTAQRQVMLKPQENSSVKTSAVDGEVTKQRMSLANVAPYLCINQRSVEDLFTRMPHSVSMQSADRLADQFRANLVISGQTAYEEDHWQSVTIGSSPFLSAGACSRCRMICIDQQTAVSSAEPLRTIATYFGEKMSFGIYLYHPPDTSFPCLLKVGDIVDCYGDQGQD